MKARAEAFGIMAVELDGQNVRDVNETARKLVERARSGEGPAFMLCNTYRYLGHHVGDIAREYYRPKEEELKWRNERDPLKILSGWLIEHQMADAGIFEQIENSVSNEVQTAVTFALNAPFPAPEEVSKHVYV
jgi:pyruvate dehydrogenase E1 component alpha subunit